MLADSLPFEMQMKWNLALLCVWSQPTRLPPISSTLWGVKMVTDSVFLFSPDFRLL